MTETAPAPMVNTPRYAAPPGSCDTHSHIFGPFGAFPPREASTYALPDAPPPIHAAARAAMGISRGVIVQPAPYGMDPSAMLNAVSESNGALKAVAIADDTVSEEALAAWSARGVRGLRFVEMRAPTGQRYPGSVGFDALARLAPRMREHGMHAQLWASAATYAEHLPDLSKLGLPLVLDHLASPDIPAGPQASSFQAVLNALRDGSAWVKLTLCRVTKDAPGYHEARPFHDACIAANPERLLWGSDWPYVRLQPAPDAGAMLDLFADWTADPALRQRILVENPQTLYGFAPISKAAP
jgi:2-pyrone-4,6-dicarboxylate lactonase